MDSGYYNDLYRQYKKEAEGYQNDIRILEDVRDSLTSDFSADQNRVNKEMNDLRSDLEKSVRHDTAFSSNLVQCDAYREQSSSSDRYLCRIRAALENEIAALNGRRAVAEQNQNESYSQYQRKKEEERQAFWNSIF